VHEDDVSDRELLDELIAERFPSWRGVLNEASRTRAEQRRRTRSDPVTGERVETVTVPFDYGDDDLVRRARRRLLERSLPIDTGCGEGARPA
jgi:hypothetical protein